jgi:hypothetical protein
VFRLAFEDGKAEWAELVRAAAAEMVYRVVSSWLRAASAAETQRAIDGKDHSKLREHIAQEVCDMFYGWVLNGHGVSQREVQLPAGRTVDHLLVLRAQRGVPMRGAVIEDKLVKAVKAGEPAPAEAVRREREDAEKQVDSALHRLSRAKVQTGVAVVYTVSTIEPSDEHPLFQVVRDERGADGRRRITIIVNICIGCTKP